MELFEIQARFQAGVLSGEEPGRAAVLASIEDSPHADRVERFGLYVEAYRLRLAEFVSNDFPVLRDHLGDDAFGRLVEDFIRSEPSRSRSARQYASRLPDFMRDSPIWKARRRACDLARLERALNDAFDAADAPALTIDDLRAIEIEDWPQLVFAFHPSFTILDLAKGTAKLYGALAEGGQPSSVGHGEEAVIVWRSGDQPVYREIDEDERLALTEAERGAKFGDVCALLALQKSDEAVTRRIAGFLAQWFADGLVAKISISP
jgi:hypothetical protein